MNTSEKIIEIIKEKMTKDNITAYSLAKQVGCSARAIQYWIKGTRGKENMQLNLADKTLKVLGISFTIGADNED